MPILLALVVLFFPRLLLVYLKFFTGWFSFGLSWLWLILGFIFAPLTLLWYSAVQNWFGGTWGTLQIVVMVAAVLTDLGGGFGATRRKG